MIKLYQKEKYFRFRNLMIAPRNITTWGSLGMQSQLIPDKNFMTVSGNDDNNNLWYLVKLVYLKPGNHYSAVTYSHLIN